MKTLLLIAACLLFLATTTFAQDDPSFTRCSYICYYMGPDTFYSGTCFFYKKASKVFLISCSHVFTGIETYTGKRSYKPDTMTIFYKSTKDHTIRPMKVPINLSHFKYFAYYDKPDIMGFEVKPPRDFDISFINGYMDTAYFNKVPDEVYFYGYPSLMQHWGSQNGFLIKGAFRTDFTNIIPVDPAMKTLSPRQVQNILNKIEPFTFLISQAARHGMSGSPVFGKFHQKNQVFYKFIGVIFGTYIEPNRSIAINGSTVKKYFLNSLE